MLYKNLKKQNTAILESVIQKGNICIDATIGNGYDILFLCQKSKQSGFVYGFDIQQDALSNTKNLLENNLTYQNYLLINSSHEDLDKFVKEEHKGNIAIITFNLGLLPGSDLSVVTTKNSTIKALNHGLNILKIQGIISVMIYTGQNGGEIEKTAVLDWAKSLNYDKYRSFIFEVYNKPINKETLLIVRKIAE